ncbi:MFS transporter [Nonomuraea cavernae]|uniref:MFS transporter n=1 Tax=Nonomuraea cavernae TaxID=2045107 RepID=A0A917ZJW1_9ACTN|nr:MFS transporter [Nonomuraea cavernae]MCA2190903.1 MFS transporter [Nonomuraea cavernae]GGO83147.1 MFS transporter [Nonomuraea cavernae]
MPTAEVRLTRDAPTWLIYLQLGTFATFLYGLSAALPLLRQDQQLSNAVAGLHGTALAAGTILAGLALPALCRRYGRRAVTWGGLAGMNAGVVLVMLVPVLPATLLGYGLAGAFGSAALYASMAALSDHHGPAGPAAISEANGVAVAFGIAMSFLLSVVAGTVLGWRATLLLTPLLTVALALSMGRIWIPAEHRPGAASAAASGRPRPGWRFHLAGGVLFCCVALEFCFNLWAAALFAGNTGLSVAAAATGLTAFTAGMAVGRFTGGRLALRLPPDRLFVGALLLAGAGWLIFWLSSSPLLGYAGLAITGLGVALHFPLGLAALITHSGGRSDLASAVAPVCSGAAVAVGPLALGALADGFGTRYAFLLVPVFIGLAIGGVITARPRA